jgi:hypothetical protein
MEVTWLFFRFDSILRFQTITGFSCFVTVIKNIILEQWLAPA